MRPGKVHEYASCTTFSTPSEYMEGHYTFHRLGEPPDSDVLAFSFFSYFFFFFKTSSQSGFLFGHTM